MTLSRTTRGVSGLPMMGESVSIGHDFLLTAE